MEEKARKNKKFWLKLFIFSSAFFVFSFLALLGSICFFLSLIFSSEVKYSKQLLTNEDLTYQQKMIGKISRQVWKRKVGVQKLTISKNEVYSILRTVNFLVAKEKQGVFVIDALNLQFPKPETIEFTLTIDTKQSKLFGGFVYLRVTCSPKYVNGKLTLNIQKMVAGKVVLPQWVNAKVEAKILAEISKNKQFQSYAKVFPEISLLKNNDVFIKYYPVELLTLMMSSR
jgi:hypothetical protein